MDCQQIASLVVVSVERRAAAVIFCALGVTWATMLQAGGRYVVVMANLFILGGGFADTPGSAAASKRMMADSSSATSRIFFGLPKKRVWMDSRP